MIAMDLTQQSVAPQPGEELYQVIQARVTRALLVAAVAIIGTLLVWTWGTWPVFIAVIAFHALMSGIHKAIDRFARGDAPKVEVLRVLINHTFGAAFHCVIGWPLPVFFWLPYTAIAFHGDNRRLS
jgi:hypothetical protein